MSHRFLAWLGYPQEEPTPLENDCAPAFSILLAPHFPKNSKNRLVQDRDVREAYHDKILTPVHVLSKGFATDLNAKLFALRSLILLFMLLLLLTNA